MPKLQGSTVVDQESDAPESSSLQKGIEAVKAGDRNLGRQLLHEAIVNGEEASVAWCWLSTIARDVNESMSFLRNAYECDSENQFAAESLVKLLVSSGIDTAKRGDRKRAITLFQDALAINPNHEVALMWKAGFAETPEEGIEILERVLVINPNNKHATDGLRQLRQKLVVPHGCFVCGSAWNSADVRTCPKCRVNVDLANPKAFLAKSTADLELVKTAAQKLHQSAKQSRNPKTIFQLALCYLNLGYRNEGVKAFQTYLKLNPSDEVCSRFLTELQSLFESASPTTVAPKTAASAPQLTILVVDDSPTIQKLVSATLSGIGYKVSTASGADEALQHIRTHDAPNLFILDVNMPGIDGFQLCKLLRQNRETAKIPVVFLTGKDGFLNKLKGQWAGATEYLIKPFDPRKLVTTVQKILPLEVRRG